MSARAGDSGIVPRLLEIMLPRGGSLAVLEAYFDESGTHDDAPVMALAGYIFTDDNARALETAWDALLHEYRLPFFRMSDCAHGNGVFDGVDDPERDRIARRFIAVVKDCVSIGVGVTINVDDYARQMPSHPGLGGAYTFCARLCIAGVDLATASQWDDENLMFLFEAGHKHQSEANGVMNTIFKKEENRRSYRYAGHGFVNKESSGCLQAADILAWQTYTYRCNQLNGSPRPMRGDFRALCESAPHRIVHATEELIAATRDRLASDGAWGPNDQLAEEHAKEPIRTTLRSLPHRVSGRLQ